MSILEKIVAQRKKDVDIAKASLSLEELKQKLNNEPVFSMVNFKERLQSEKKLAIMAEVKRASPSRGDIAPDMDAAYQGTRYAYAGAAVISCLTEPTWFKGTLDDLKKIRHAIETIKNRPALLRKDFIVDIYQIYEARLYGADTILLIVASLSDEEIKEFMEISRGLNMEPLVEVANVPELKRAINLGAKVIGINNRDLHTFNVDLETTGKLVKGVDIPSDTILAALSGISTRKDVEYFESIGVKSVLVGESLMVSNNAFNKIKELQGLPYPLVKICGVKSVETAIAACESGADFIGLVLAKSTRQVNVELAKDIVNEIKKWRKNKASWEKAKDNKQSGDYIAQELKSVSPLVVGVFVGEKLSDINRQAKLIGLDIIQLHTPPTADEPNSVVPTWVCIPVDPSQNPSSQSIKEVIKKVPNYNETIVPLLDTKEGTTLGGTGKSFDWSLAADISKDTPCILAGGLNSQNIQQAVRQVKPWAVDVSSGVETAGIKDFKKIRKFISNAKNAYQ